MISLIIPPKDQIARAAKMLADEYGTASNIKSRVNRWAVLRCPASPTPGLCRNPPRPLHPPPISLSVLGAITSVQQRLKLYTKGEQPLSCSCSNSLSAPLSSPLFSNSPTKRSCGVLRHDRDGRGQGEEGEH